MQNVHFRFPSVAQKRSLLKRCNITCEGVSLLKDGGEPEGNDMLDEITSGLKLFLRGLKASERA